MSETTVNLQPVSRRYQVECYERNVIVNVYHYEDRDDAFVKAEGWPITRHQRTVLIDVEEDRVLLRKTGGRG